MKHTTSVLARLILASVLSIVMSSQLLAQTTYSYLGQPFTIAGPPYTTADRVTGAFTLPLPLPPSLSMEEISGHILDYSFADGVQTHTPANSAPCVFWVTTDASGNITDWSISLRRAPYPGSGNPHQFLDSGNFGEQVGEGPAGADLCDSIFPTTLASTPAVGNWTSDLTPGSALTYQYLGNLFTTAMAPYTVSDRVTGDILLGSPLPPFLPPTEIGLFVLNFNFQDGVQTRTPGNTSTCTLRVATDGGGNIIDWQVFLREMPLPTLGNPQQFLDASSFGDSVGEAPANVAICDTISGGTGAENSTPGSWTSPLAPGTPTSYNYVGEPFTAANTPWMAGQNVTGDILLGSTLPPNLPLTDVSLTLLNFTFQDGVQVRTPGNSLVCGLRVATDASGDIVDWFVSLRQSPMPTPGPQQFLDSTGANDQVGEGPPQPGCNSITPTAVATSNNPGTWIRQASTADIPTLSPAALALLGLALMIAASRALTTRPTAQTDS